MVEFSTFMLCRCFPKKMVLLLLRRLESFARTGNVPSLAFQCTEMYSHDAERHTIAEFERTARTVDGGFTLSQTKRAEVLRKLDLV